MRMTRVYCPLLIPLHQEIHLDEKTSHYLSNVLRFRTGQMLTLFNGDGKDYVGKLIKLDKKGAVFMAEMSQVVDKESHFKIYLGQAISKGERMDWVIQKAVELGVTDITPLITEYCNVKLDEERREKRHEHWQRVAISAAEQCGRAIITTVHTPTPLSVFLQQHQDKDLKFMMHYRQAAPLSSLLQASAKQAALIIGPEGGLTDIEVTEAIQNQFQITSLGPRILRTETAPVVAISILQAALGDLRRT